MSSSKEAARWDQLTKALEAFSSKSKGNTRALEVFLSGLKGVDKVRLMPAADRLTRAKALNAAAKTNFSPGWLASWSGLRNKGDTIVRQRDKPLMDFIREVSRDYKQK